jgi:hypothetical protein
MPPRSDEGTQQRTQMNLPPEEHPLHRQQKYRRCLHQNRSDAHRDKQHGVQGSEDSQGGSHQSSERDEKQCPAVSHFSKVLGKAPLDQQEHGEGNQPGAKPDHVHLDGMISLIQTVFGKNNPHRLGQGSAQRDNRADQFFPADIGVGAGR